MHYLFGYFYQCAVSKWSVYIDYIYRFVKSLFCVFVCLSCICIPTNHSEVVLFLSYTWFKIVHGLFHFPSGFFNTYSGRTPSTNRPLLFHRPFARTNYFYNSFVPRTVAIWNTLPLSLVSNSYVPHFRSHVWMHITH